LATVSEWVALTNSSVAREADELENRFFPIRSQESLAERLAELRFSARARAILDAIETAATGEHTLGIRSQSDEDAMMLCFRLDGQPVAEFRPEDAERLSYALYSESRHRPDLLERCCALFEASL